MGGSEELERLVRTVRGLHEQVHRDYRVQMVAIFGSYARGESQVGSDVDVLVNFDPDATLFDMVGLAQFLEERLDRRVDVVPADTLRDEIRAQVLREAVPL